MASWWVVLGISVMGSRIWGALLEELMGLRRLSFLYHGVSISSRFMVQGETRYKIYLLVSETPFVAPGYVVVTIDFDASERAYW